MSKQSSACTLRALVMADVPVFAELANDREVWLNLRDRFPHPFSPADAERFIEMSASRPVATHFGIVVDSQAVGAISLAPGEDVERKTAELGYWLGRPYWGKGIMTDAVRMMTAHGFEQLGLHRIFAVPFEYNVASHKVLEKAGYVREGVMRRSAIKEGKVVDQFLYATYDDTERR